LTASRICGRAWAVEEWIEVLLVGRGGGVRVGVGRAPEVVAVLPLLPLPAATFARPVDLALAAGEDP